MPERRSVKSVYSLNGDHQLVIRYSDGQVKTLNAEVIAADSAALTFSVSSRDRCGNDHLRVLRLGGSWQADERNRLSFIVNDNREDGVLVFRNSWKLGDDQEIVYEYEKRGSGARRRFSLDGHWKISPGERLTYALGKGDYGPEFRCQLESLSLRPKEGCIRFRIGFGVAYKRKGPVVSVYGGWRFGRGLGIDFDAGSNGNYEVDVSRSLKSFGGTAFLRLLKSGREKKIAAGISIPF